MKPVTLWRSHVEGITLDWSEDQAMMEENAVDDVEEYVALPRATHAALVATLEAVVTQAATFTHRSPHLDEWEALASATRAVLTLVNGAS